MKEDDLITDWVYFFKKAYGGYPDENFSKGKNLLGILLDMRDNCDEYLYFGKNSSRFPSFISKNIIYLNRNDYREYLLKYYKVLTFEEYKDVLVWNPNYLKNYNKITFLEFKTKKHKGLI